MSSGIPQSLQHDSRAAIRVDEFRLVQANYPKPRILELIAYWPNSSKKRYVGSSVCKINRFINRDTTSPSLDIAVIVQHNY